MKVTINLLPPDRKETIRTQQSTGTVLKIGSSAITAIMVFLLFLSSCLFIINIQKDVVAKELVQLRRIKVYDEVQKTHETVSEYYQSTQQLDRGLSDQVSYVDILEKINSLLPSDLFLQEVLITENKLVVNGFSSNRDSLIEFRNQLEAEDSFGLIEAPISNFTASENVNFMFTIEINS